MNNLLLEEYISASIRPTDINQHLETLLTLASEVYHVTELGVRDGQSTRAFLAADCKLRSYDLYLDPNVQKLFEHAQSLGKDVQYIKGNSLNITIEPTDFLFIDTDHHYNQLRQELLLHHDKVSKYIGFHDTVTYGGPSQGDSVGLLAAILEFLADHPEWRVFKHYRNNNGVTILERTH